MWQFNQLKRSLFFAAAAGLLTACASVSNKPATPGITLPPSQTPPVSTVPPVPPVPPAPVKPGLVTTSKFKLTSVSVSWLDNPGLPVLAASGAKVNIGSGDMINALTNLKLVAPKAVMDALKSKGVSEGSGDSVTLMPVGGLLDANGSATSVLVRATVTQRASGTQWRMELELGDRKQPVVSKTAGSQRGEPASQNYAASLANAMSQAGLF